MRAFAPVTAASALKPSTAVLTAAYPPRNAKDEPRNAGTLRPVMRWNSSVPRPANISVALTGRPVMMGTSTVAPNMANTCCRPRIPNLTGLIFCLGLLMMMSSFHTVSVVR